MKVNIIIFVIVNDTHLLIKKYYQRDNKDLSLENLAAGYSFPPWKDCSIK